MSAYRELAKTDKSMKGSANISAASATHKPKSLPTASASTSVSAASKSKGKEREKTIVPNLPPPFTTIPLNATSPPHALASVSTGAMEVDGGIVTADTHRYWEEEEEEGEDVNIPEDVLIGATKEVDLRRDVMELDEPESAIGTPHTLE